MSINKPNLDVSSARTIARGQISIVVEDTAKRIASLSMKFPSKRGAWLRAVENNFKEAYKETLLALIPEKRRVLAVYFLPLAEQYDGWLAIEVSVATFGTAMRTFKLAAITENTIIKLMQGLKDCSHLDALKNELLDWFLPGVMTYMTTLNRPEIICIPTKSGYFIAKWDHSHITYVFTNWQPDRLLTDKEQVVLSKLRREKKFGVAAELGDCE
ncbi:MAG: hypothetical protein WCK49_11180 [Myxococcaceae bacterium]